MATARLGMNAKLERDVSSTLTPMANVMDANLALEAAIGDATTRGSGGFEQSVATIIGATLTFDMLNIPADADFTAIKDAFLTRVPIEMRAMDGPTDVAGAQGLHAKWIISKFARSENLREAQKYSVEAKPTFDSTLTPTWVTTSGS